jgi:phosphatidylinositol-3-phosphatase
VRTHTKTVGLGIAVAALALTMVIGAAIVRTDRAGALGATTPHLVVIVMENKEYTDIVGADAAPYINGTLLPASRVFTGFYASDHPSLPNYLTMTSATPAGCLGDGCPPAFHHGENLFHQLDGAGIGWKLYAGGMPSNCFASNTARYLVRHNPPVYYSNLSQSCATRDVPIGRLSKDLSAGSLPPFAWIAPDAYDSMHSNRGAAPCELGTTLANEICQGDRWLARTLPSLLALNADADTGNDVTVVLTFDEGRSSDAGGGHVLTLVTGPNVAPGQDDTMFGHLGLLNAFERWFGVRPLHPKVPPL